MTEEVTEIDPSPGVRRLRPLTGRQSIIWNFVCAYQQQNGFPPSYREIGDACGIKSTNGVNDHLLALQRKGYIARQEGQVRSIRLLKPPHTILSGPSPLVIVVAREPLARAIARLEQIEEWIPRPIADKFENAIADLRVLLIRGSNAAKDESGKLAPEEVPQET